MSLNFRNLAPSLIFLFEIVVGEEGAGQKSLTKNVKSFTIRAK